MKNKYEIIWKKPTVTVMSNKHLSQKPGHLSSRLFFKKHNLAPVVNLAFIHMEERTVSLNQNGCTNFAYHLCVDSGRKDFFTFSLCCFGSDRNKPKANTL